MRSVVSSLAVLVVFAAQGLGLGGCTQESDVEASLDQLEPGSPTTQGSMATEPALPESHQGDSASVAKAGPVPVGPRPVGHACTSDDECGSGFCTDGVCCETACDGSCESCAGPGSKGICLPHEAGTDPEQECGAPACENGQQETFSCDGAGACQVEMVTCGAAGCGHTECL